MLESTPSASASTDRNLLFGVLALQADLIDETQFIDACGAWAARKNVGLDELLIERGWISSDERSEVQRLLERKLKKHGDARASLAAAANEAIRLSLSTVDDPEVRHSLDGLDATPAHPVLATTDHVPGRQERYLTLRLHASGGIGRVWLALDEELGREVALKDLRPDRSDSPVVWARFLREARVTGQLEHPGVVPVYELARRGEDGRPFYTMRFVKGRTLSEAVHDYHARRSAGQAGPLDLHGLLNSFVAVCNTIAYAHARGVIHRDLKGANVVLGDYGEVIVLDWGLAKLLGRGEEKADGLPESPVLPASGDDSGHTVQGQVMGTPSYMAPEQAAGRVDLIEPRTDVYGLGAILYELLTGQPPYTGPDRQEILRRVREEKPQPPRQLCPEVAQPLEAICLKALARAPADRYISATEVAREVQRWLADEPVAACREPLRVRAARWARRHRPVMAAAASLLLATVAALAVGLVLLGQQEALTQKAYEQADKDRHSAEEQRDEADTQRARAEHLEAEARGRLEEARRHLYGAQLAQTALLAEHDPERGLDLLDDASRCPLGFRGFAWDLLRDYCDRQRWALKAHRSHVASLTFTPDGQTLVSVGDDPAVRVVDVAAGTLRAVFPRPVGYFRPLVSGDGKTVVLVERQPVGSAPRQGLQAVAIQVWDVSRGRQRIRLPGPAGVLGVAGSLSSDGSKLALVCGTNIHVWNTRTAKELHRLDLGEARLSKLTFSSDGKLLAGAGGGDGKLAMGGRWAGGVKLWDLGTGQERPLKRRDTRPVNSAFAEAVFLGFDPQGKSLTAVLRPRRDTVSIAGGSILIPHSLESWDTATGEPRGDFQTSDTPHCAALSPDGQLLALGLPFGLEIWDLGAGKQVRNDKEQGLLGYTSRVSSVAFSPDSRTLATVEGGLVKLWDLSSRRQRLSFHASGPVAFAPGGSLLAAGGPEGSIGLWQVGSRPELGPARSQLFYSNIRGLTFTPDGRTLAIGMGNGSVDLRSLDRPRSANRILPARPALQARLHCLALAPDGQTLAAGNAGHVRLWDSTGQPRDLTVGSHLILSLAFSPDGRILAGGLGPSPFLLRGGDPPPGTHGRIVLWDAASGKEVAALPNPNAVAAVAFSPDGKTLAAAGDSTAGEVVLWDVSTRKPRQTLKGHRGQVLAVAYARAGQVLASGGADGTVRLWDVGTAPARPLATLAGHTGQVACLAFAPDGKTLASGATDRSVRLWNLATGQPQLVLERLSHPVHCLTFSPTGAWLVAGTGDPGRLAGYVLAWKTVTGGPRATLQRGASDPFLNPAGASTFAPLPRSARLALAPDGTLAATSADHRVRLWSSTTAQERSALPPLPTAATALAFRPDGRSLVVASLDEVKSGWNEAVQKSVTNSHPAAIHLCDPASGEELASFPVKPGTVSALAFAPDGETLAIGTASTPALLQRVYLGSRTSAIIPLCAFSSLHGTVNLAALGAQVILQQRLSYLGPAAPGQKRFDLPGDVQLCDRTTGKVRLTLSGHAGSVWSVAFSAAGDVLATASQDGTVKLWDVDTGKVRLTCTGHDGPVYAVAISPDGTRLASASADGTTRLWDATSGRELRTLGKGDEAVLVVAFSSDGRFVAAAGADLVVRVWDSATGEQRAAFRGHRSRVTDLAFAADGHLLASIEADGTVKMWDLGVLHPPSTGALEDGKPAAPVADAPLPLAYSPDGKTLARGEADGSISLWDVPSGHKRLLRDRHRGAVLALGFSLDGKVLASGGQDGIVKVWDPSDGKELAALRGHTAPVRALAFSPDGRLLASGAAQTWNVFRTGMEGEAKMWDLHTYQQQQTLTTRAGGCWCVAFSCDGRLLAFADAHLVRLWSLETDEEQPAPIWHERAVYHLAFSPDGRLLATAGADPGVSLWEVGLSTNRVQGTHHERVTQIKQPVSIRGLAFTPDSRLVVAGDGRSVHLFDATPQPIDKLRRDWRARQRGLEERGVWKGHDSPVASLALSRDGTQVAVSCRSGTVRLWDARMGLPGPAYRGEPGLAVQGLAFAADQSGLVLGTGDVSLPGQQRADAIARPGAVLLYDAATGKRRARLAGHKGLPLCAAFSPDGKLLATGGHDGTVRLWDAKDGKAGHVFSGHKGAVLQLVFAADGHVLASVGRDGDIRLWDVAAGKALTVLAGAGSVSRVLLTPRGDAVVTLGEGKTVKLWDAATGKERLSLAGRDLVALSPDGKLLGMARQPSTLPAAITVQLWEVSTAREKTTQTQEMSQLQALTFTPDGKLLLAIGREWAQAGLLRPALWLWDTDSGRLRLKRQVSWAFVPPLLSPDGKTLALVASLGKVVLEDLLTGEMRTTIAIPPSPPSRLLFSPDGKCLAVSSALGGAPTLCDMQTGRARPTPRIGGTIRHLELAGDAIVAMTWDRSVHLCNAATGKGLVRFRTGAPLFVTSWALSADGKSLAIVPANAASYTAAWKESQRGEVLRLDLPAAKLPLVLSRQPSSVWQVAVDPTGRLLAWADRDGTIRLWDRVSGKEHAALKGHKGALLCLAFSADGRLLASAGADETVRLWRLDTKEWLATFPDIRAPVSMLAFSSNGQTLAGGCRDGRVGLWQVSTGKQLAVLAAHRGAIKALDFSPDGQLLASAGSDGMIRLWERDGRLRRVLRLAEQRIVETAEQGNAALTFSRDGKRLLTVVGGSVQQWDTHAGAELAAWKVSFAAGQCWRFSPGGRTLAIGGSAPLLAEDLALLRPGFSTHPIQAPAVITAQASSPDGRLLAVASARRDRARAAGEVSLYPLGQRARHHVLAGHKSPVHALAFSASGAVLATADGEGTVKLWDTATGKEQATLTGPTGLCCLALSADGTLLAAGNEEGTMIVWETATRQQRFSCRAHPGGVRVVAFSPDGKQLASGGDDRAVKLWDCTTGKEQEHHSGYAAAVSALAFSPDGKVLATAGGESAYLLDAPALKQRQILSGHAGRILALAFSPDGKQLATAGADRVIKARDPATGQVTSEGKVELAPRALVFEPGRTAPTGLGVTAAERPYASVASVDLWEGGAGPETLR